MLTFLSSISPSILADAVLAAATYGTIASLIANTRRFAAAFPALRKECAGASRVRFSRYTIHDTTIAPEMEAPGTAVIYRPDFGTMAGSSRFRRGLRAAA